MVTSNYYILCNTGKWDKKNSILSLRSIKFCRHYILVHVHEIRCVQSKPCTIWHKRISIKQILTYVKGLLVGVSLQAVPILPVVELHTIVRFIKEGQVYY